MNEMIEKINTAAGKYGIDLVGFAGKERFDGVPAEVNPFSIFPDGKTVIMLGKRICRGTLRGVEEGSNFGDYQKYGNNWLEDEFLASACYEMTRVIEDEGWEAVPVFPNPSDVPPMGVPVEKGKPAPNVFPDFNYAAVAAGLCELSFSGLAFSPRFGSRQRFHMIITDLELPSSPMLEQTVCDGCGKCADICPMGAISKTETETAVIAGKAYRVAKIDRFKCSVCKNGAVPNRFYPTSAPDRVAALCNRTCLCHLEENGLVGNLFENRFRKRDFWALDRDGNYITKQ